MKATNTKKLIFCNSTYAVALSAMVLTTGTVYAKSVADSVIAEQREMLQKNTEGKGFGPQSPRDIDQDYGTNLRNFAEAPNRSNLNLCNIHFHKNAEHKGGGIYHLCWKW